MTASENRLFHVVPGTFDENTYVRGWKTDGCEWILINLIFWIREGAGHIPRNPVLQAADVRNRETSDRARVSNQSWEYFPGACGGNWIQGASLGEVSRESRICHQGRPRKYGQYGDEFCEATQGQYKLVIIMWILQTFYKENVGIVLRDLRVTVDSRLFSQQRQRPLSDVTRWWISDVRWWFSDVTRWWISLTSQDGGSPSDVTRWRISLWRHKMVNLSDVTRWRISLWRHKMVVLWRHKMVDLSDVTRWRISLWRQMVDLWRHKMVDLPLTSDGGSLTSQDGGSPSDVRWWFSDVTRWWISLTSQDGGSQTSQDGGYLWRHKMADFWRHKIVDLLCHNSGSLSLVSS